MVLSLKVPLVSIGGQFQLHKYVRTPMYFDGQICQLQQQDFVLARRQEDGEIQVISGDHLSSCRAQDDFLCYLPRLVHGGHMSSRCMHHLFAATELKDIQQYCSLSCRPAKQELEIVEFSPSEYIVANIQANTTVTCEGGSFHHLQPIPGAMYVGLPCHCEISVGGRIMVRKTFPCDANVDKQPQVLHYLPLHWVKFNSLKIDVLQPHFNPNFVNFSEILKTDKDIKVPEFTVQDVISSDIFHKVDLPNSWGDVVNSSSFVFYILFGWLGFLTLFCAYLGIKLYVCKLSAVTVAQPKIHIIDS
ncbi:uncharacterized protein LOC120350433 [Nilaparvata lugens]|uniref:uncharacterized protein LOC120350433 n=1 Tax=Nilaparvata lugens TaxID=108931 RepID=UPI00193E033E|nr:uncharacterized protein LOC120350433 [Nilaparvata lugens]